MLSVVLHMLEGQRVEEDKTILKPSTRHLLHAPNPSSFPARPARTLRLWVMLHSLMEKVEELLGCSASNQVKLCGRQLQIWVLGTH